MKANYVAIILYDKSHNLFEAWPSYALESKPLENNFVSDWEIFTCMYRCRKHLLPKIRYKAPNKPPINSTTIGYIIQMNVIYHWLPSTLCMLMCLSSLARWLGFLVDHSGSCLRHWVMATLDVPSCNYRPRVFTPVMETGCTQSETCFHQTISRNVLM